MQCHPQKLDNTSTDFNKNYEWVLGNNLKINICKTNFIIFQQRNEIVFNLNTRLKIRTIIKYLRLE